MPEILMPRLSESMEEGTIVAWLRDDGVSVSRGDELVEIETDKATIVYEADFSGVLTIVVAEKQTVPVGAVIAIIGDAPPPGADRAADDPPASTPEDLEPGGSLEAESASTEGGGGQASPVARRLADWLGVELGQVSGTGREGRITKADVQSHAVAQWQAPGSQSSDGRALIQADSGESVPEGTETARGTSESLELTRTQQLIARRMSASRATVPSFEVNAEVDMTAVVARRVALRTQATGEPVPSLNDFVVRACALALRQFPRFNGSYADGRLELYSRVNIGVAVALTNSLVVPTVFDADTKGLVQIAEETREIADRARAGSLTPPELGGGTFTVSNLGMRGVSRFTAIINQPQLAILAVGAAIMRPAVVAGQVLPRAQMDLTLACDHRAIYGADAADFLAYIRGLLESSTSLTA